MSTILAIDLGKFKSVACVYRGAKEEPTFQTIPTRPTAMHDLIVATGPAKAVIEVGRGKALSRAAWGMRRGGGSTGGQGMIAATGSALWGSVASAEACERKSVGLTPWCWLNWRLKK